MLSMVDRSTDTAADTAAALDTTDPLGQALHFLRMSGTFYCRSELSQPWGIAMPPLADCLMFHIVVSGGCWLEVAESEAVWLRAGDLGLVPHGTGHVLRGDRHAKPHPIFQLQREQVGPHYEILRHGGGGEASTVICGAVRFDHPAAFQLLRLLPKLIHVDSWSAPEAVWIKSTVQLMSAEAATPRPGGEAVITRLADILVIQAIRSWIATASAAEKGWLCALEDKQVGRALMAMQRRPGDHWSVASLAGVAAMSRSAFSARFLELVGESPMHYVTRWRMSLALNWLREHDGSIAEIAERLGYQSETAFSRAFRRHIGKPPGAVRRVA